MIEVRDFFKGCMARYSMSSIIPYPLKHIHILIKEVERLNDVIQDSVDAQKFKRELRRKTEDFLVAMEEVEKLKDVLKKIADPRLRSHKEPDAYSQLGCVMNMAQEALE